MLDARGIRSQIGFTWAGPDINLKLESESKHVVAWNREFLERFIILETTGRVDGDSTDREPLQTSSIGKPTAQKEREVSNVVIFDRTEIYRIRRKLELRRKSNASKKEFRNA